MITQTSANYMNTYLFGSSIRPVNLVNPTLIRPSNDTSDVQVDAAQYMASGGGRFAPLAQAEVVQNFFNADTIPQGEYSLTAMRNLVGGLPTSDGTGELIVIKQYNYGANDTDYLDRVFYYNSTSFKVREGEISFVVDASGNRSIENARVLPLNDNFDYESRDPIASITGSISQYNTDPSEIGRIVRLRFDQSIDNVPFVPSYNSADFQQDSIYLNSKEGNFLELIGAGVFTHYEELYDSGITKFISDKGEAIVYGNLEGKHVHLYDHINSHHSDAADNIGITFVGSNSADSVSMTFTTPLGVGPVHVDMTTLYGFGGNDTITGGSGADVIEGGAGADTIDGGDGHDLINFDVDANGDGVTLDFASGEGTQGEADGDTYTNIEAAMGTTASDTFVLTASAPMIVGGGGGNDTFRFDDGGSDGGEPSIVWGGAGADTFDFTYSSGRGVMIVNIDNLTEDNFHLLDLDLLKRQFGSDLDWDQIGTVIVNPDSEDRLKLDGNTLNYGTATVSFEISGNYVNYGNIYTDPQNAYSERNVESVETVTYNTVLYGESGSSYQHISGPVDFRGRVYGTYSIDFLGGGITSGFGDGNTFHLVEWSHSIDRETGQPYEDEDLPSSLEGLISDADYQGDWQEFGDPFSDLPAHIPMGLKRKYVWAGYSTSASLPQPDEDNPVVVPPHDAKTSYADVLYGWFIVGGKLSGTQLVSNDSISFSLPTLSGSSSSDNLQGGNGNDIVYAGAGSDIITTGTGSDKIQLYTGDGQDRITDFTAEDTIIIDGTEITDLSVLPGGVTSVSGPDGLELHYGNGDVVILEGFEGEGDNGRIDGTAGDDIIDSEFTDSQGETVSSGDDVVSGGKGNDILDAGAGNDTYVYTLGDGNDVIDDDSGFNTLDLSSFNTADVTFRSDGAHNLYLDFADGAVVKLHYQFRFGADLTNRISEITFADGVLDEQAIYDKALADQSGNATVLGTHGWDDTLQGDGSDQTLKGGYGDDTIRGGAGDDFLQGEIGNDTFIFAIGDGTDTVHDSGHSTDHEIAIFEGRNFNVNQISLTESSLLFDFGNGDSVIVAQQTYSQNQIDSFVFEDRTLSWEELQGELVA